MEKPFLYDLVDKLYHGVMDKMPQAIQDRNIESAFILGSVGIYSVVRGLQWTSKNVVNKFLPIFDEKYLPKLEKVSIVSMATFPILYTLINPKKAKQIKNKHPSYTSGMTGVCIGSIIGAVQGLNKQSKDIPYKKF